MSPETSSLRPRRIASFTALLAVMFVLLMIGVYKDHELMEVISPDTTARKIFMMNMKNKTPSLTHRKLFNHPAKEGKANSNSKDKGKMNVVEPNRIWSENCSESDIVISQGATDPLPNGIPTYTVEIMNVCTSGCNISAVHLSCGWFSSARLINPRVFKRLDYDDCLVNDGKPITNGRTLSFQYANTFQYPLSVSSVTC